MTLSKKKFLNFSLFDIPSSKIVDNFHSTHFLNVKLENLSVKEWSLDSGITTSLHEFYFLSIFEIYPKTGSYRLQTHTI